MKRGLFVAIVTLLFASPASAQGFRPLFDHVHLAAPDVPAAVAWYRDHFGGQPMTEAPDRLMFGETRVIIQKRDNAQPSQGSAIDHIGFSVADLDGLMKKMEAEGVKIAQPVRDVAGLFKLGFIEDPWGTRIEVVQDSAKLGLHHIHLRAPDPAATLAWYSTNFGGKTGKLKDRIDGLDYGGVWLLVTKGESVPSQGHSIDHIGMRPIDVDAAVTALKAHNAKITTEPRPLKLGDGTMVRLAFAEDPGGVRIEMVQRPEGGAAERSLPALPPGVKVLIENPQALICDISFTKANAFPMERYAEDVLVVPLSAFSVKIDTPDGKSSTLELAPGRVHLFPKGTRQALTPLSDGRAIVAHFTGVPAKHYENTTGFAPAFPRPGVKKLLETDRLVVWDYTWAKGKRTPMHFHDKDVMIVYMADGTLKSVTPDAKETPNEFKFADVRFNLGNRAHYEEYVRGEGPRAIITELK